MPSAFTSSTALLRALRRGDPRAVTIWYHRYQRRLTAFIARRVSQSPDVEELVQETFINCLTNLPQFAGHSSLWTWMCAIAKHEIGDYYRKRYAKKVLQLLPLPDWFWDDSASTSPDDQIITSLLSHELKDKIDHVFQQIGDYYRELLLEKYLDRHSVKELAARRAKTPKAIESDLFRARRAFKTAYAALD
jgi:RNA polymerase sigma-70 factor (ECF subfamily)